MTVFLINFLTELNLSEALSELLFFIDFALFWISVYIAMSKFMSDIGYGVDSKKELLEITGSFIGIIILGCFGLLGIVLAFVIWFGVQWVQLPNE